MKKKRSKAIKSAKQSLKQTQQSKEQHLRQLQDANRPSSIYEDDLLMRAAGELGASPEDVAEMARMAGW